ncbi:metallophosphoesterase [Ancylobacter rudongensis]|uniref:Calcineurin-like phosphoesterase superfamily domain-containing protein n=1 Tax=Ancylobacter rudongensis TaxID=177413 RepID=A0A1G4US69_9HYPH|nr:metallophosphoesterase [Ancylobacter rudongensis]SCW95815.1 Calcineurin-like phosphoesterase superfamily domain-containing protein [Ancylobacter rudongensis]
MIYGVVSDIHCHAWSLFSRINPDGVNSRLRITLNELERAATVVLANGGRTLVIPGDILHTRGTIDPEVLNPLRKTIEGILDDGVSIYAIPGNHDLKSEDSQELSSAIQNLAQISIEGAQFKIFNRVDVIAVEGQRLGFVPWRNRREDLLKDLETLAKQCQKPAETDVFIHAGIEGVLPNMPASGLTDKILGDFGFRHVFAGHYHNHKVMQHGVISVGATTHHNWGDVGSRAGFLLVGGSAGAVTFQDTHAPKFVDVSGMSEEDIQLGCDGNYVRFRGPQMTQQQITELREQFKDWGALGTSIEVPRAIATARAGAPRTAGVSLATSVQLFVDASASIPAHVDRARVKERAAEVLAASQAVYEDA